MVRCRRGRADAGGDSEAARHGTTRDPKARADALRRGSRPASSPAVFFAVGFFAGLFAFEAGFLAGLFFLAGDSATRPSSGDLRGDR